MAPMCTPSLAKFFVSNNLQCGQKCILSKSLVSRITVSLIACQAGSKLPGTKKQPLDFGIRVRIWQIATCKTDDIVVNLWANATIPSANSSATQPLHKSFVPMSIRTTFGASARTAPNSLNKPSKVSPPYLGRQPSQTYVKGGGRDSNSVVLDHRGRSTCCCIRRTKLCPTINTVSLSICTRTVSVSSHSKKIMHNSTFSEFPEGGCGCVCGWA